MRGLGGVDCVATSMRTGADLSISFAWGNRSMWSSEIEGYCWLSTFTISRYDAEIQAAILARCAIPY